MDPAPPPPNHADTVPGFTMQSEAFFLKFVTGLQCGVSSKLLEYETDWYEVMEILLSRLQDEPERKEKFQTIASRDLEYWARIQPGGDTLNLKIRVSLEEKRYFLPPSGSRKTLRLIFNDRFSTQVIFHARKKMLLKSLRELAAIAVADHFKDGENIKKLDTELPRTVIPDVKKAFDNCWTPRFFRSQIVACPPWCACKSWKRPLALTVEGKVKTPTRRELYKKVVGKPVSKKSQQKKSIKKIEVKNNKQVKSRKSEKVNKQVVQRSNLNKKVKKEARNNSNKQVKNEAVKAQKKSLSNSGSVRNSVSKQDLGKEKTKPIQSKLLPDMKNKIQSKAEAKNSPQLKSKCNSKRPAPTPSVKKVVMKNVDNVKALKNQVKSMKNKLKALMDAVATVAAKGRESKSDSKKRNTASNQGALKRRISKGNEGSTNNLDNPSKKRKVDVKTKPNTKSKEDVFSPRPRRSVESSNIKSNYESNRKSKPTNVQSKSGSDKKSSDAKFTIKSRNQTRQMKLSPGKMPMQSSKSKSSKSVEVKMPKIQTLKRVLRSQVQEAPTMKRRRG